MNRYRAQSGFSIIEALLVVTLIGLLAAIAIPALTRFLHEQRMSSDARQTLAAISLARAKATASNIYCTFHFDRSANSFQVSGAEATSPDGVWYPWNDTNGNGIQDSVTLFLKSVFLQYSSFSTVSVPNPLPSGEDPANVTDMLLSITFAPNGSLSGTDPSNRCVVLQNQALMIRAICADSGGTVRMYKVDANSWIRIY